MVLVCSIAHEKRASLANAEYSNVHGIGEMWLINSDTYQLENFIDSHLAPRYAILSHTWESNELVYKDMREADGPKRARGHKKIRYACEQAAKDRLSYIWIDTICINKSDSSELSEAINSMYRYYQEAQCCYAFLADVDGESARVEDTSVQEGANNIPRETLGMKLVSEKLTKARWFTRGWTLQELIAPSQLRFYDQNWQLLGSRHSLREAISSITHIDERVLIAPEKYLKECSIAKRMSWAANRQTTRLEDEAYSLLGIFEVNMPMLYGEGRHAFIRLQEEIIRRSTDLSIFAWLAGSQSSVEAGELLALSPQLFAWCEKIISLPQDSSFHLTNVGLEGSLLLYESSVMLSCYEEDKPMEWLALNLDLDRATPKPCTANVESDNGRIEIRVGDEPVVIGNVSTSLGRILYVPIHNAPTYTKTKVILRRSRQAAPSSALYLRLELMSTGSVSIIKTATFPSRQWTGLNGSRVSIVKGLQGENIKGGVLLSINYFQCRRYVVICFEAGTNLRSRIKAPSIHTTVTAMREIPTAKTEHLLQNSIEEFVRAGGLMKPLPLETRQKISGYFGPDFTCIVKYKYEEDLPAPLINMQVRVEGQFQRLVHGHYAGYRVCDI